MKIGIDARLWNETGVGRYVRSLYQYLPELDDQNEYIWFFLEKEYGEIKMPHKNWRKVKANIRWHTLAEQLLLPWIFYKEKLDLLHFPYFSFPILYPRKFVIHIYDLIYDHYKTAKDSTLPFWLFSLKKFGYHFITWSSMIRASAIMTLSEDAKSEIVDHYHINPGKIFITYESGKLENKPTGLKKSRGKIKQLKPYILYVGSAHSHKNLENLILATKRLAEKQKNIKLVLIGNDDFFYPRLKKFVHRNKLTDQVIFVGFVPNSDLAAWYQSAICFATASNMEGFGIPPLEAMSVGCPVIVSNIPVFREIYGNAAVYFNQNDPKDIAKTISTTIADQKFVRNMIEKGYKQTSLYSWKKTIEDTVEVYKKMGAFKS